MTNAPGFEAVRVLDEPATAWARSHRSLFLDDGAPVREQIERRLAQLHAFPELDVNAHQPEFLVGAFAASALVFDARGVRVVMGEGPAAAAVVDLIAGQPDWTRAVAFLMES